MKGEHAIKEEIKRMGRRKAGRLGGSNPGTHFQLICAFITTHFPLTFDFSFPLIWVVDLIIALKYMLPTLLGGL